MMRQVTNDTRHSSEKPGLEGPVALGIPEIALCRSECRIRRRPILLDAMPDAPGELAREARPDLEAVLSPLDEALELAGANPDHDPRSEPGQ